MSSSNPTSISNIVLPYVFTFAIFVSYKLQSIDVRNISQGFFSFTDKFILRQMWDFNSGLNKKPEEREIWKQSNLSLSTSRESRKENFLQKINCEKYLTWTLSMEKEIKTNMLLFCVVKKYLICLFCHHFLTI